MELLDRIDALISQRHLLKHPFYADWRAGTLPREALQDYAAQYYAFESSFPRFLSALHSRSDRPDVRQALLDNLWTRSTARPTTQSCGCASAKASARTAPRFAAPHVTMRLRPS